jgi:hypothetical protein
VFAGSGGGRRFATLNNDSDDGDDEPQNYFSGGERRHIIIVYRFPALFSLPSAGYIYRTLQGTLAEDHPTSLVA